MTAPLALDGVTIALGASPLIAGLALEVAPGEATTVMGPSGSGKSTLLAFVCGTLDPAFRASGRVRIGADDVTAWPAHRRRIGILFQDDMLFPHLSVGANLAFGLAESVRGREERRRRVLAALAEAELESFAARDPASLSGGQRQRVAVMRTLLSEPRALLLDEPFGRLDAELRARFRGFVFEHAKARGLPILLVTHDPADAEAAGGRVIALGGAHG